MSFVSITKCIECRKATQSKVGYFRNNIKTMTPYECFIIPLNHFALNNLWFCNCIWFCILVANNTRCRSVLVTSSKLQVHLNEETKKRFPLSRQMHLSYTYVESTKHLFIQQFLFQNWFLFQDGSPYCWYINFQRIMPLFSSH